MLRKEKVSFPKIEDIPARDSGKWYKLGKKIAAGERIRPTSFIKLSLFG